MSAADEARAEAVRRYPENRLVPDPFGETGEAWTDPYGYNEDARKSFIAGAEWQASRADTSAVDAAIQIAPNKVLWRAQCSCGWLGETNRTKATADNRVRAEHIRAYAKGEK